MKKFLLFVFLLLNAFIVDANNIRVSNVALINQDKTNNTWQVKFDVAWDNSWRTSTNESNWDAAWVFIKYRPGYSTEWRHAFLSLTGFSSPGDATVSLRNIALVSDSSACTGALIHRNADGIGNVNFPNIVLSWNYGTEIGDGDKVEIFVSAIEMVFVPEGGFALGDGGSAPSTFKNAFTGLPFPITSESALTLGGQLTNSLAGDVSGQDFDGENFKPLPAKYPKGFAGFYCMKYECSTGQFTDFLNKITFTQSFEHYVSGGSITYTDGLYSTTVPDRAVNFVGFRAALAYADWSGLRLMTDLEYEKACRGSLPPVEGETAGGRPLTELHSITLAEVTNAGTPEEAVSSAFPANHLGLVASTRGLRCGSMANPASSRLYCDGSYYGIQDLTGNLSEYTIGVTALERINYANRHGDGSIGFRGSSKWESIGINRGMLRSNTVSGRVAFDPFTPYVSLFPYSFRCVLGVN